MGQGLHRYSIHLHIQHNEVLKQLDVMMRQILHQLATIVTIFQHHDLTDKHGPLFYDLDNSKLLHTCAVLVN